MRDFCCERATAECAADAVAVDFDGVVVLPAGEWPGGRMSSPPAPVPSSRWTPARADRRHSPPTPSYRSTCCLETPTDYGDTWDSSLIRSRGYCCSDDNPSD